MWASPPVGTEPAGDLGSAVVALTRAIESVDAATLGHSHRVRRYATELAHALDPALLEDERLPSSFLFHDLGKTAIPARILSKPGPLTPAEQQILEEHTIHGERMLADAGLVESTQLAVARSHHERWDGRGYPDGLAGTDIPLAARVVAVADALDAMTSDRPYRPALGWDQAVAEIVGESGTQFDPELVECLKQHQFRLRRIHYELAAPPAPARLDEGGTAHPGRGLGIFLAALAVGLLVAALVALASGRAAGGVRAAPEGVDVELFREINRVRAKHGLTRLLFSRRLAEAGRALALSDRFTHDRPSGTPLRGVNVLWMPRGLDATGAVRRWLRDPMERQVLLSKKWREIGVRVVEADRAAAAFGVRG
jgi:hypothetical protein